MASKLRRGWVVATLSLHLMMVGAPAMADEYDSHRSGHPLRLLAYLIHPVGVVLDTLIFRPAHWLVSHEPGRTLFGHTD